MAGLGPRLPLGPDATNGHTLIQTHVELVKQNFKMLLLTLPGEKCMDPQFGAGLRIHLFELDGAELRENIVSTIHKQVNKYMSYLKIDDIRFKNFEEDPSDANRLNITIVYNITPLNVADIIDINLG